MNINWKELNTENTEQAIADNREHICLGDETNLILPLEIEKWLNLKLVQIKETVLNYDDENNDEWRFDLLDDLTMYYFDVHSWLTLAMLDGVFLGDLQGENNGQLAWSYINSIVPTVPHEI